MPRIAFSSVHRTLNARSPECIHGSIDDPTGRKVNFFEARRTRGLTRRTVSFYFCLFPLAARCAPAARVERFVISLHSSEHFRSSQSIVTISTLDVWKKKKSSSDFL